MIYLRNKKVMGITPIAKCKVNEETAVVYLLFSNSKTKEFEKMSDAVNYCKKYKIKASIINQ